MSRPGEPGDDARLAAAIERIDEANSHDPFTIEHDGTVHVKELLHSQMMTDWVRRLDPDAGECQLLAARAHHFRRWTRPRADYPEGRAGYLRWRADAKRAHAREVGEILIECGYGVDEVDRVGAIIRKERRATDPEVQTHEDALCLVFLQTQLTDVAERLGDDETAAILAKTVPKLSPAGIAAASTLELDRRSAGLLARAVAEVAARSRDA